MESMEQLEDLSDEALRTLNQALDLDGQAIRQQRLVIAQILSRRQARTVAQARVDDMNELERQAMQLALEDVSTKG